MQADSVCAYHRFSLGIGWKQPNRCQHPEHKFHAGKKEPKLRCIPFNTIAAYNEDNPPLPLVQHFALVTWKLFLANIRRMMNHKKWMQIILQRNKHSCWWHLHSWCSNNFNWSSGGSYKHCQFSMWGTCDQSLFISNQRKKYWRFIWWN